MLVIVQHQQWAKNHEFIFFSPLFPSGVHTTNQPSHVPYPLDFLFSHWPTSSWASLKLVYTYPPLHMSSLASWTLSPKYLICVAPLTYSFLILSILVTPTENLTSFIHVTHSSAHVFSLVCFSYHMTHWTHFFTHSNLVASCFLSLLQSSLL